MLKVKLRDVEFKNPIITAAGTFGKGYELADSFDLSKLGGIIPKTITLKKRAGNPFPRLVETPCGLINSIGLENDGIESFVKNTYPVLKRLPVKIIASISGETIEEYVELLKILVLETDIEVFEINLSCPNVEKGGEEFSQDVEVLTDLLLKIRDVTERLLWAKLPPDVYGIIDRVRAVVSSGFDAVVLSNTYRATYVDVDKMSYSLAKEHGGLSGPAILPVSLYIVKEVKKAFPDFPVVASGGVFSVEDVVRYILVGAHLVEIGTMNFVKPEKVFTLPDELATYLHRKKKSLGEIRGYLIS